MIDINLLQTDDETEYETALKTDAHALLYGSIKYRNLLRQVTNCQDLYLIAKNQGEIVGILPFFLKRNSKYGDILNSLPFYGSNGGVMCRPAFGDNLAIKRKLLDAAHQLAIEKGVVLSTIITSPFEADTDIYETYSGYNFKDSRIGLICRLPQADDIELALMEMIHSKTRNLVKKAVKENIVCRRSNSIKDLKLLAAMHKQNMEAIGGIAKDWSFFQNIPEIFEFDKDYCVYIAELNNKPISTLLVFYYHLTVEYYTPAIVAEYRNLQPNSLLIYEAMKDASTRGFQYWNWGGTWVGQDALYHFKKRWGADDYPYHYYVKAYRDIARITSMEKHHILQEYPFFYVVPFSELVKPY